MNKEQRKFKKVVKARKITKRYKRLWNILHNNTSRKDRAEKNFWLCLPKSKKHKPKKNDNKKS